MVGLTILLEGQRDLDKNPQIINKITVLRPYSPSSSSSFSTTSFPSTTFLDSCFLCKKRLSPHRDIYMYRGDRAFCSVECRCRQIFMDEENQDSSFKENCSVAASQIHPNKRNRNRAGGLFAY
ncbi:hypothetical protein MRB53_010637 [Persea americana]|uniref:Uncharacterized protein n=1 Tax=Persea americana TaxID=3435 RepID=A0ACC2LSK8_PERAE|nr:hypothetical protein MRB53_010637 [Persea americana]